MRPLTFLELTIVVILLIGMVVYFTVGMPRKNYDPCAIIKRDPYAIQEYKESCKNLEKWYGRST